MKNCFAYVRVSTQKQGVSGVSLQEQRSAIEQYAASCGIAISRWFEERQSAAKIGRPQFDEMISLLKKNKASGVVMHKIDRSARNINDWASVSNLVDTGIEFHFAVEGLDLASRGGRIAAEFLATIAADYSRNLRFEARKGFIGRLKQGYYPLAAPQGYLDMGGGQTKEIDPVNGPVIKRAFELYATGAYSIDGLQKRLKIRNRKSGKLLSKHAISKILHNPFYIGIMKLPGSGDSYRGNHAPLISKRVFDDVQTILAGKVRRKENKHRYIYARLFRCKSCDYALTAETQKGNIYYRCHTKKCPTSSLREEALREIVDDFFASLSLDKDGIALLKYKITGLAEKAIAENTGQSKSLEMRLRQTVDQIDRLTDAFVDGMIDKKVFNERRLKLEVFKDELTVESSFGQPSVDKLEGRVTKFFELLESASFSLEIANEAEKVKLLKIMSSNRRASAKNVDIEPREPWRQVQNYASVTSSGPERTRLTDRRIGQEIFEFLRNGEP